MSRRCPRDWVVHSSRTSRRIKRLRTSKRRRCRRDWPGWMLIRHRRTSPRPTVGGAWQQLREELNLSGFWEIRGGLRTQFDRHQHQASIGESRVQLEIEKLLADKFVFKLRSDLVYDAVVDRHTPHLERGAGFMDLREASVGLHAAGFHGCARRPAGADLGHRRSVVPERYVPEGLAVVFSSAVTWSTSKPRPTRSS